MIQEEIRDVLDKMVMQRQDFNIKKDAKKLEKEKAVQRERELVEVGKLTRENVARQLVGAEIVKIGGGPAALCSDGTVGHGPPRAQDDADGGSGLLSPTSSGGRSVKRRKTSSKVQSDMLSDSVEAYSAKKFQLQEEQLKLERQRHEKDFELRRRELDLRMKEFDENMGLRKRELDLKVKEMDASRQRHQDVLGLRMKELDQKIAADKAQSEHYRDQLSMKMKDFELQMMKMRDNRN